MKQNKLFRSLTALLLLSSLLLTSLFLSSAAPSSEGGFSIELLSPGMNNVSFHTDLQQAYLDDHYTSVNDYAAGLGENSRPKPVSLAWVPSEEGTGSYTVLIGEKKDLSDAKRYEATECSLDVYNLKIGTRYFWAVECEHDGTYTSPVSSFATKAEGPRNLYIDGVTNARDMGGWPTADGKRVAQGKIFRTARLNENNSRWPTITPAGIAVMRDELGVRTEIDLRRVVTEIPDEDAPGTLSWEGGQLIYKEGGKAIEKGLIKKDGAYYYIQKKGIAAVDTTCKVEDDIILQSDNYTFDAEGKMVNPPEPDLIAMSENGAIPYSMLGEDVQYIVVPMGIASGRMVTEETAQIKQIFELFADESNYPIFFHCKIGTDRTGLIAYLLNALLGVEQTNLYTDYLFSNFGDIHNKRVLRDIATEYVSTLDRYRGADLAEKVYNYLHEVVGVATKDLDNIRRIMLEEPFAECAASGHSLVHVEGRAPSCTEAGWKAYDYCENCAYNTYESVVARGHDPQESEEGLRCSRCEQTIEWSNPFTDVKESKWFYSAARYVNSNKLMDGTTATTFAPNDKMTRSMLVTVLWRIEGEQEAQIVPYSDVRDGAWFSYAVFWATDKGIVNGKGEGVFAPNDRVTREEICAIFCRYAAYKGNSMEEKANLNSFVDAGKVSKWAKDDVARAVAYGLIKGETVSGGMQLRPRGDASRAEVATIIMRFLEND